jgi:hypothetical protein
VLIGNVGLTEEGGERIEQEMVGALRQGPTNGATWDQEEGIKAMPPAPAIPSTLSIKSFA